MQQSELAAAGGERLRFQWYEDPLTENDIYNCVKLREKLDIPIMATEMPAGGIDTYATWITEGATDYLRGDVSLKGGITTMVKTAHLAEAFNMQYEIHHGGNSINNTAGLHVAMAIRPWFMPRPGPGSASPSISNSCAAARLQCSPDYHYAVKTTGVTGSDPELLFKPDC